MSNFIDGSYGSAQSTELIAKVLAGRCEMRYTRATVGKGRIPDDRTPTTMTESAEYVMDAKISGVSNPVKGECQVTVQIKSDDVQEDFRATNVVLFAEDPDVGEIPYAYLCLENEPEWIGAASSSVGKLITFEIIVFVGGVDNVSISINSESIATIAEVEKLIKIHNLDVSAHDEKFKKHIAMTTDQELINSLINNTAKAGSLLLFSYIGHKNGNVTGESYNLYTGLNNCNLYSGCVIRVKLPHESVQQEIHPNYFQHPSFYLAKIDESNAKQVTIYPLGGNTVEIIDNLTSDDVDKALSAAQGKWLNENKLGKREKAADSSKLDGHFSNYFATYESMLATFKKAGEAYGKANEAYTAAKQAFTSASEGKSKVANTLTGMGTPTSTTATWDTIVGNMKQHKYKTGEINAGNYRYIGQAIEKEIDIYNKNFIVTGSSNNNNLVYLNGFIYNIARTGAKLNVSTGEVIKDIFVGNWHNLVLQVIRPLDSYGIVSGFDNGYGHSSFLSLIKPDGSVVAVPVSHRVESSMNIFYDKAQNAILVQPNFTKDMYRYSANDLSLLSHSNWCKNTEYIRPNIYCWQDKSFYSLSGSSNNYSIVKCAENGDIIWRTNVDISINGININGLGMSDNYIHTVNGVYSKKTGQYVRAQVTEEGVSLRQMILTFGGRLSSINTNSTGEYGIMSHHSDNELHISGYFFRDEAVTTKLLFRSYRYSDYVKYAGYISDGKVAALVNVTNDYKPTTVLLYNLVPKLILK